MLLTGRTRPGRRRFRKSLVLAWLLAFASVASAQQQTTSTAAVWSQKAGEAAGLDFEWDFYADNAYAFTVPLFSASYLSTNSGVDYFRANIPPQAPGVTLTARACKASRCSGLSNAVVIPPFPTPTPTDTFTPTNTATATHSATPTRTYTATTTPTVTRTVSATPTRTPSLTPHPTFTRTATAMPTVTPMPTDTPTLVPPPLPPLILEIYHSGNVPVTIVVKTMTPGAP